MERRYLPFRLADVVACAEAIRNNRLGFSGAKLGRHWREQFLSRHPELKLTTSKRIDEKRVMAKNPAYIMEYYVMVSFVVPLFTCLLTSCPSAF